MISDDTMQALQCGAALAGSVRGLRLQLRGPDGVLAEVTRPPFTANEPRQITSSSFREAVLDLRERRRYDRHAGIAFVPAGVDPVIDIGVLPGDLALPGAIVRTTMGRSWAHLAPVARSIGPCLAAIGTGLHGLGTRYEPDLGVTVLHVRSPAGDDVRAEIALETITDALARCAVADMESLLRVGDVHPVRRRG